MATSLANRINSEIISIPLDSNSSTKYDTLLPMLCELTGLASSDIHVTAAKAPSNAEGRLRNGKHQNRHYELCVLLVSSDRIEGAVEQAKKHIDNQLRGYFNTIVFMIPASSGKWTVSDIVTNNSGPVVSSITAVYPAAKIHQADNATFKSSPVQNSCLSESDYPLQLIYYGAPGTGKSKTIKKDLQTESKDRVFRTTFHPDSDYASFVGCYKPAMEERTKYGLQGQPIKVNGQDLKEDAIVYRFGPQVFLKAYAKAWEEYAKDAPEPVYLVIEEINRGNCAQIFGDLFQLLDRNEETGCSEYPIVPDDDLRGHLAKVFDKTAKSVPQGRKDLIDALLDDATDGKAMLDDVFTGGALVLPPNLYIWATMNTSDQSLFPIDSAFKRRWEWEYVPIREPDKNEDDSPWTKWKIEIDAHRYDWWTFLGKINGLIVSVTGSEDKKLGYFFAKAKGGVVSAETFVGKVAFYLWHDVFKDFGFERNEFHGGSGEKGEILFTDFFEADGAPKKATIVRFLENLEVPDESLEPGDSSGSGSTLAAAPAPATQTAAVPTVVPGGMTTPLPPTPAPVPAAP